MRIRHKMKPLPTALSIIVLIAVIAPILSAVQTFDLAPAKNYTLGQAAEMNDKIPPFEKEPDLAGQEFHRGFLPTADDQKHRTAFIWAADEKKLYIDKNNNRDLTDDEPIICEQQNIYEGRNQISHTFERVPFVLESQGRRIPYTLRIDLSRYGSNYLRCYLNIISGFEAEIELDGRKRLLGFVDNLNGKVDSKDKLFLKPIITEQTPYKSSNDLLPIPKEIFFDGRNYQCDFVFQGEGDNVTVKATLTEKPLPMGTLRIDGKMIEHLVLKSELTVVDLDEIKDQVAVPAGTYKYIKCDLVTREREYISVIDYFPLVVIVPQDGTATLKVAAPLKSMVEVQRSGNYLKLDYKLIGQGGESYRYSYYNSSENKNIAPGFIINKKGKTVASGSFEYG